jgi:hypothetical protein
MHTYTVAVYGAAGHTGRFVANELERRRVTVRRISRGAPTEAHSPEGGRQLQWARASCDEPEALDRALEGADAVINCAGPFLDTAPAVVEAALRTGTHYLDIAAEQRSVRQTLATYASEAMDKGIVVLPAMAFYGGLADLLVAQLCAGRRTVDEILIGIALDYWHPTAGTRRTGERNTARRVIVSSVPLSEIITISKHITATRIESFLNEAPLQDLEKAETPPPTSVEASGRSSQTFVVDVSVTVDGVLKRIAAFGRDIYAVSAPLVVEACMRVLSQSDRQGGTFAAAELFDPQEFLSALSSDIRVESISQSRPMEPLQ